MKFVFRVAFLLSQSEFEELKTWFCPKLFYVMMKKKIINNSTSLSGSSLKQELVVPGMPRTVFIPGIRSPTPDRI